ncbi:DUF1217 domain-containing protein [Azospirillum sp. TSO35-2]|uniref:DUF1217 domain-containing protein n=1 Tax=Azospirillum sp. TSO35-2 TaxID=716796 RepID=UPI000D61AD95|nr:DUF1217 domain-containing protein [Azospirillum sp. TSO35-2]PWC37800.1 flagellar biosynthesis protein FlgG [Azospirillum sp. TSO35-2]
MTTILDLRQVTRNHDRYEQMIRQRPAVQRAIAYFQDNIGKVSSTEEFMKDDKLYRFVLDAFDLGSQAKARGLIRKVLEEGVSDSSSTANRMSDAKFKEMATVLGFAENSGKNLKQPAIVQAIIDRYVNVTLEIDSEDQNPAVRLGLYFKRRSSNISNWYQVMADSALRKVVYTTLGLPDQTALLDIDKQKVLLEKRMDIADFKKPEKVAKLLDRFAAMYDLQNGSSTATAATPSIGPISASGRASIISIDPSITMSLLRFPRF